VASVTAQPLHPLERAAGEPEWHRLERIRAKHFDGFTWALDPPTDEGFEIPRKGDTAQADSGR